MLQKYFIGVTLAATVALALQEPAVKPATADRVELGRPANGAAVKFVHGSTGQWGIEIAGASAPRYIQPKPAQIQVFRDGENATDLAAGYQSVTREPDAVVARAKVSGGEASFAIEDRWKVSFVKKADPVNATTVGWTFPSQIEFSKKFGKPILNTETACIARANPYDEVLEIAQEHKTGRHLFNLIVSGYWGQIHGIFYPDGTVRDPAIVADTAERALRGIEAALKDNQSSFNATQNRTDRILDAAEYAANLLESAEMVPMFVPPTAQIKYWRSLPAEKRDRDSIRQFAYDLGLTLKKYCRLYCAGRTV